MCVLVPPERLQQTERTLPAGLCANQTQNLLVVVVVVEAVADGKSAVADVGIDTVVAAGIEGEVIAAAAAVVVVKNVVVVVAVVAAELACIGVLKNVVRPLLSSSESRPL